MKFKTRLAMQLETRFSRIALAIKLESATVHDSSAVAKPWLLR